MNFSKFIFVTSESNQDGTVQPPIKNNNMISVTRPIIKYTDSNPPPPNETTKTFHDQMIEICRNNNIQLTHDDNLIGSATGIGDILLKFASIKFKTDCTPFYFNLESFTRPYYSMNPINQLEFRIKLIRELREFNNIPTDMVRFIYSKNPNINSFTNEMYQRMNDFKLDLKLISSNAIDGEYIVFHTKCRHRKNENYGLLKQKLKSFCSNYKTEYKIVILGERNFPHTEEVDMHGITQIYNELLNLKKNNQVIDMSIDCIYSNLNYETYKKDIEIIKHATHNISFGVGGAFCNSLCFGKSTIIYCKSEIIEFNIHRLIHVHVHHFNAVEDCFNYIIKITSSSLPFKLQMLNCMNKQIIAPIDNCTVSDAENKFIELASNNKSKNIVFCSHMGLGDVLLNAGIINLLLNFYETVHYFCKREYVCNVSTMFANKPVNLVPVDKFENQSIISNMKMYNFNTTDCILAGIMKNIHPSLKSVIQNEHFNEYKRRFGTNANKKTLYQHVGYIHSDVGVNWDVCLKYYDVHIPSESMLYYQKIQQYTIMFMHEIASTASTVDFSKIIDRYMNLPNYIIICANRNVYPLEHPMHALAQPFVNMPFMFYYDTVRNATDIHVVDSCFSCIPLILRSMNAISPKTFRIYARDKPYDAIILNGQVILS
jgi:hypothetical protein